jgi:transcriptional regulator with XRE-family HTH domain
MNNQRFLFTAGQRLRGLRELMGVNRPAFALLTGIDKKRLENIENGLQRMHDIDFEKVCSLYPEFTRWIAYGGPVDGSSSLKVADSGQMAAVYMVHCNPVLLDSIGLSEREWASRHQPQLQLLSDSEALHKRQLALEAEHNDDIEGESQRIEEGDDVTH